MKNKEIVRALREHAEWAQANEWETHITLSDDLAAAADLIQRLTARCARYAEEIAVAQERTRWVPVEERLPEISNSWGYRMLSCASLAILPDTHRRIRDCVYIWRMEDGRATGRLCGSRTGCRCRMGRRWSDDKAFLRYVRARNRL